MAVRIEPCDIGSEPSPSVPAEDSAADGWKTYTFLFFARSPSWSARIRIPEGPRRRRSSKLPELCHVQVRLSERRRATGTFRFMMTPALRTPKLGPRSARFPPGRMTYPSR